MASSTQDAVLYIHELMTGLDSSLRCLVWLAASSAVLFLLEPLMLPRSGRLWLLVPAHHACVRTSQRLDSQLLALMPTLRQ